MAMPWARCGVKTDTNTMILAGNNPNYTGTMIITQRRVSVYQRQRVGHPLSVVCDQWRNV